jgi:hypothetical protein
MTVLNSNNKHVYNGNGVTVNFPYTFTLADTSHMKVYWTNAAGQIYLLSAGYTVDTVNKWVTYLYGGVALPTGHKLTLLREVPNTQLTDLQNQRSLDMLQLEAAYDKLTMMAQQLNEVLSRCLKYPVDVVPTSDDTELLMQEIRAVLAACEAQLDAVVAAGNAKIEEINALMLVYQGDTAPPNPTVGKVWYKTGVDAEMSRREFGVDGQWRDANNAVCE